MRSPATPTEALLDQLRDTRQHQPLGHGLDVGLPGGMNGRQLADEALRRRSQLKVLFTSGYARNAIVHHGRLDPGVELLSKPFTFALLGGRVRRLLDGK
jgi:DNA-binding response OmpR family regulator